MKLKFKSDLNYQWNAIKSVVDIFKGQRIMQSNFTVYSEEVMCGVKYTELGIGNYLELTQNEILKNVQEIQIRNGIPISEKLQGMNFTVEMETGTGKTYVYLRTIYELNKKYGFTKFIIVVPSVAIREGVYKTLQITKEHFNELYDNKPAEFFIYDALKLTQVKSFATSNNIQIMIINIDAFRKFFTDPDMESKSNIIHRPNDRLNGLKPIQYIQETNPIVIIDEPQSVDTTDKAKEAIASLNPLCTIRYSATHVDKYNMVYKLDAVDAYENNLVKKIEVMSVKSFNNYNLPYIKLVEVAERKAKVEIDIENNGKIKRTVKAVKLGDDLYDITKREIYQGFKIEDISWGVGDEFIEVNGNIIYLNQSIGEIDDDEIKRFMIRKTIEEHLNKELKFKRMNKNIKVLSLFFIDKVANYRDYDQYGNPLKGKYALMFEEEYKELIKKPKYRELFKEDKMIDVEKLHNGYFAQDKKGRLKDTKGNTKDDDDVYSLIMRDKEKLLSLEEPLKFIFSHSALREGWDNPNVFQICTLKDSAGTYIKRRQEIGRGLRLCVDENGERVSDKEINILTVMANESYHEFVANLQKEIEEDTGIKFGAVEKYMFANIYYEDEESNKVMMGYELSNKLHEYLTQKGYLKDNKITDELSKDVLSDNMQLPEEFLKWQNGIIRELKRRISKLDIKDATKKKKAKLNKVVLDSEEFRNLWNRINQKTIYSLEFDSKELIKDCIEKINKMPRITPPELIIEKAQIYMDKEKGVYDEVVNEGKEEVKLKINLPDILTELQNKTRLTRGTIVDILVGSNRLNDFKINPQKFIEQVSEIINRELKNVIKDGIRYHKIDDYYRVELFYEKEIIEFITEKYEESKKSPYDAIIFDSNIELDFAKKFEKDEHVKVYAKLPNWFKIPTPLGDYNPDWAVVIEKDNEEKLYFVVESKGTDIQDELRPKEDFKIECAKKHFKELGVDFKGPEKNPTEFILDAIS